jgi:hypothetical protein
MQDMGVKLFLSESLPVQAAMRWSLARSNNNGSGRGFSRVCAIYKRHGSVVRRFIPGVVDARGQQVAESCKSASNGCAAWASPMSM